MEHNTDRILWTVLILAIGVGLYASFKPAANHVLGQGIEKIQNVATNVNSDISLVDKDDNSPFTYQYDTNAKIATITGYKLMSGDALPANLEIPAYKKHDGVKYTVTSIGDSAFKSKPASAQGVSVILPNTIKTISRFAFDSTPLTSVHLPSGLTSIGDWVFADTKLTSVDFPASLTSIGNEVFFDTPLTSIDLPAKITSIGGGAFYNTKLTSVDLPASLTSIGPSAFADTKLTSVDLPASLTSIGDYAFWNTKLTSVDFPASLTSIDDHAFYNTPISAISFKKRVDLSDGAFAKTALTNVTLPTGSTYKTDTNNSTFDPGVTVTFN